MTESSKIPPFLRGAGMGSCLIEPLAGDASTRRYFRIRPERGRTAVVMDVGGSIPLHADGEPEPYPFLRWRAFYAELALHVPEVLAVDREAGLVLLEDFGDELLQKRVETEGAAACADLYRQAALIGRRIGRDGTSRFVPDRQDSDDPLVARRLAVEMDFFLVHAVGARPASLAAATGPLREARLLLDRLCLDVHVPQGHVGPRHQALCHRDFHARNLVVLPSASGEPRLGVLDFQDTRRGPRAYDLASLAWDPYVTLPPALVEELVSALRPDDGTGESAWDNEVRLAAGQRLLKAAGTYAYLSRDRGRVEYIQWFVPAITRALERLSRWEHCPALRRALHGLGLPI